MSVKYIFVTGGVVSGLGKGITAASLGRLLKARGYKVTMQKFDPYLNVDPGHMSPYQHGEVFVTDDGAETDLDVGHYERFIDESLSINSNVTSGKIYWSVLNKERQGEYNGKTVQVIPHITSEIKERMKRVTKDTDVDVVITEIGGTVGDIESLPLLEAIRQIKSEDAGAGNTLFIHVTLVPFIEGSNELKSKPTQHSVKELRSLGIQPDILVCRSEHVLPQDMKEKIALFCSVRPQDVIDNQTAENLYEVPLLLEKQGLANVACEKLSLENKTPDLKNWSDMVESCKNLQHTVKIAVVGKYVELADAYISASEALKHGGYPNNTDVHIELISSEDIEKSSPETILKGFDGIVVPGGFGDRGSEGKINAIKYGRENKIPTLGIALGMQMMAVEFARNVLNLNDSESAEFEPECENPIIIPLPNKDGAVAPEMRLGLFPCKIEDNTKLMDIYDENLIYERHRHKYEFNMKYKPQFEENGFKIACSSPDNKIAEGVELESHPWFVGVEFHPEFKSRPNRPHPLFTSYIKAVLDNKN